MQKFLDDILAKGEKSSQDLKLLYCEVSSSPFISFEKSIFKVVTLVTVARIKQRRIIL